MPLNNSQQEKLSALDLSEGSGIFSKNKRINSVNNPIIVISLGGLGGKTLNQLKREIKHRVNPQNSIRLLAIDSADQDLVALKHLGDTEKFPLYDPTIPAVFSSTAAVPPYIKSWLNPQHLPALTGAGCGGTRQNGRCILSAPAVYSKLRAIIANTINAARTAAPGGRINVVFIAGVSGGTGSGTFIDMAYLVQDIIQNDIGIALRSQYTISGYIYTPDVQFNTPANNDMLKANGYAALKELDYYYNLDKNHGTYVWPFSEGPVKNKTGRIYDFCTLISAIAGATGTVSEESSINVAVESLLSVITDNELTKPDGTPEQLITSFLDNDLASVSVWMATGGSDTTLYPRSANYCYNVVGFGSAKIPVDAIMSYLAAEGYGELLTEYRSMDALTQDFANNIINSCGVGAAGAVIESVKEELNSPYRVVTLPTGSEIRGRKVGYTTWRDNAIAYYKHLHHDVSFNSAVKKVTSATIQLLDSRLTQAFDNFGPYFVSRLLTATQSNYHVDGILSQLDSLINAMIDTYNERTKVKNSDLILHLDKLASSVPAIVGVVSKENHDKFINTALRNIELYTIEMTIIQAMIEKLREIRDYFNNQNNSIFDVYTQVLDAVNDMLAKNSDTVISSEKVKTGTNTTYSLNIISLDVNDAKGLKLKQCIDSFLTPTFKANFKDEFRAIIRDPQNRPAFTDASVEHFDAAKVIQDKFESLFATIYQDALERFLIVFYSSDPQVNNWAHLDTIMNNTATKNAELTAAATEICKILQGKSQPLCGITGGAINAFAGCKQYMSCPENLFTILQPLVNTYFPGITLCRRPDAFSIDVVSNHIGIPLARIQGMNDADISYNSAIKNSQKGLHLDENIASNYKMLPAPFVNEVWNLVSGVHTSEVELQNLAQVDALYNKLIALDLLGADINQQNAYIKSYFNVALEDAVLSSFKNTLDLTFAPDMDLQAFIETFLKGQGIAVENLLIYDEDGLSHSLANVKIFLRKRFDLFMQLQSFIPQYEKMYEIAQTKISALHGASVYNDNILSFANFIKTGVITYDSGVQSWNYYDGIMERTLYKFMMQGPFEKNYNLFFAYAKFDELMKDTAVKNSMMSVMAERIEEGKMVSSVPDSIVADKAKIFAPGTELTKQYILDREINLAGINTSADMYKEPFGISLPICPDKATVLRQFYNDFTSMFQ